MKAGKETIQWRENSNPGNRLNLFIRLLEELVLEPETDETDPIIRLPQNTATDREHLGECSRAHG